MWTDKVKVVMAGTLALATVACSTMDQTGSNSSAAPMTTASTASGYGVVQSIDLVPVNQQQGGIGLGTVGGAVVGGLLGNQIGSGSGRTAATVAGAAGGAYAGHKIEENRNAASGQAYRISVLMDDGSVQTLTQNAQPNLRIGQRVRLANGAIVQSYQ